MLTCFFLAGTAILGYAFFVAAKLYFLISHLGAPPWVSDGGSYLFVAARSSRTLQSALVPC